MTFYLHDQVVVFYQAAKKSKVNIIGTWTTQGMLTTDKRGGSTRNQSTLENAAIRCVLL